MQSLARARTSRIISHHLFSSAAVPGCGFRTLSHAHADAPPQPSTFSPLNIHRRLHPDSHSLARFFFSQSGEGTSKTQQHVRVSPAGTPHVNLKTDEDNDTTNVGNGTEYLQITQRRQGFIAKVYGIVATQLLATVAVSSAVVFNPSLSQFIFSTPRLGLGLFFGSLLTLWPMHVYKNEYPKNFICLVAFTLMQSLLVGSCCALMDGNVVLEALATTTAAVTSLTGYTFWAAKRGKDFSYLGPILFPNLIAIFTIGLINVFVYPVPGIDSIAYNAFGALVFSGYLVLSTDDLIKRYEYDEYITASINIYLDIINLFVRLMQILSNLKTE